jgi:hypothetical protein
MRLPIGIDLLALLIELAHTRTGFHGAFGGVEHQETWGLRASVPIN